MKTLWMNNEQVYERVIYGDLVVSNSVKTRKCPLKMHKRKRWHGKKSRCKVKIVRNGLNDYLLALLYKTREKLKSASILVYIAIFEEICMAKGFEHEGIYFGWVDLVTWLLLHKVKWSQIQINEETVFNVDLIMIARLTQIQDGKNGEGLAITLMQRTMRWTSPNTAQGSTQWKVWVDDLICE